MKNKIFVIIIIFVLILINYTNFSYGFVKKDYDSNILVIGWLRMTTKEIISDLRDRVGYEGATLTKEMKLKTSLKITDVNNKKYQLKFRK